VGTTERREKRQEWGKVVKSNRGSGGEKTVAEGGATSCLSPLTWRPWRRKRPVRGGQEGRRV